MQLIERKRIPPAVGGGATLAARGNRNKTQRSFGAMEPSRSLSFRVGDWHVDPALDVISGRDGASTKLVPKSMEVLVFLARRAGVVVNEEEIHAAVWPDVIVTSSSVYQA